MSKIKSFKIFESSIWFRGYTSTTKKLPYVWLSKNRSQAVQYSELNKAIYGGNKILGKMNINLDKKNILDLTSYDMDDQMIESELENVLDELNIEFDYESLFDFSEESIPLSRLINNILSNILDMCDGFRILEDGNETICIKR